MFILDLEKLRGIYRMIENLGTAVGLLLYNSINDVFFFIFPLFIFQEGSWFL